MTKNKFYKTVVKRIVTITSTEKNEFEGSVLECVIKFTNIVNPLPNFGVQRQYPSL